MDRLKKITHQIESMNLISKKVIKYGFISFLFIILLCLVASILNRYLLGDIYQINKFSLDIFKSSFSMLAIIVIGGLIMDYIAKSQQ